MDLLVGLMFSLVMKLNYLHLLQKSNFFFFFFQLNENYFQKKYSKYIQNKNRPTHWKQVSFFLTESFLVHQDDKIKGKIFVKKNPLNNRFIDVVINHQTPQTQELSHSYSISDCISNEKEKS